MGRGGGGGRGAAKWDRKRRGWGARPERGEGVSGVPPDGYRRWAQHGGTTLIDRRHCADVMGGKPAD